MALTELWRRIVAVHPSLEAGVWQGVTPSGAPATLVPQVSPIRDECTLVILQQTLIIQKGSLAWSLNDRNEAIVSLLTKFADLR